MKVAAGEYKKIPYFSHQSSTQCTPSGERGLAEAFRLAIGHLQSLHMPEARFSSGVGEVLDQVYQRSETVSIGFCEIAPKVGQKPYRLLLSTSKGPVHLLVLAKRLPAATIVEIKQGLVPTIAAFIMPDFDGIIRMRDVLGAVCSANSVSWISLPEMDTFAAEQRRLQEAEQQRIQKQEAEQQAAIQRIEEERHAEEDRLRKEKVRQLEYEAKTKALPKCCVRPAGKTPPSHNRRMHG